MLTKLKLQRLPSLICRANFPAFLWKCLCIFFLQTAKINQYNFVGISLVIQGWTKTDASVVCKMMGLVIHPDDWKFYSNIPGNPNQPIWRSNVDCTEYDMDLLLCPSDDIMDHSCNHTQDIYIRCYPPTWGGVYIPFVFCSFSSVLFEVFQTTGSIYFLLCWKIWKYFVCETHFALHNIKSNQVFFICLDNFCVFEIFRKMMMKVYIFWFIQAMI